MASRMELGGQRTETAWGFEGQGEAHFGANVVAAKNKNRPQQKLTKIQGCLKRPADCRTETGASKFQSSHVVPRSLPSSVPSCLEEQSGRYRPEAETPSLFRRSCGRFNRGDFRRLLDWRSATHAKPGTNVP